MKIEECKILHESFSEMLPNKHKKNECWGIDEVTNTVTQGDARYELYFFFLILCDFH